MPRPAVKRPVSWDDPRRDLGTYWSMRYMELPLWRLTLRLLHFRWIEWICRLRGHRQATSYTWKCRCLAAWDYGRWLERWADAFPPPRRET